MESKKRRLSKDNEKQYQDFTQKMDQYILGKNKFDKDPNDFFMQTLRERISKEVTQKIKNKLIFWSRFAKAEAVVIALLLGGQAYTLHQTALYQKEINMFAQANARMELNIQNLEKSIDKLHLQSALEAQILENVPEKTNTKSFKREPTDIHDS